MIIRKLLDHDVDLKRHSHWFKWACWLSLAGFYLCARFSDNLSWDGWQSRMLYALGVLVLVIVVFSQFIIGARRVPIALLAVAMLGMELARVGDVTNVDELRKSTVMVWLFTVALALVLDAAGLRKSPRQPADASPTSKRNRTDAEE